VSHGCNNASQIMYGSKEYATQQYPDHCGYPAKSNGDNRPNYRACACNGGEMVAQDHNRFTGHIIYSIFMGMGWSNVSVTHPELFGYIFTVGEVSPDEYNCRNKKKVDQLHFSIFIWFPPTFWSFIPKISIGQQSLQNPRNPSNVFIEFFLK